MPTPIILPRPLRSSLEAAVRALLERATGLLSISRNRPASPRWCRPIPFSWRIFKNPLSLFIGGVTAVIMELAEPRVRTGVWEHTTFRQDPIRRLRRTGLAAMVTIYGARSTAEAMIARVRRVHDRIAGTTPSGEPYCANDPQLLNWVQATAAYGLITPMCSRSSQRSVTAITPRAFRPQLFMARRAHRDLRLSLKICFKRCAAAWSAQTLCLSFSRSCARRPFCRCCCGPRSTCLCGLQFNLTPRWARTILGLEGDGLNSSAHPMKFSGRVMCRLGHGGHFHTYVAAPGKGWIFQSQYSPSTP
jgi:ER-bound oxygenase mpaB/B'/Rubber oxygenase, catalytic domain